MRCARLRHLSRNLFNLFDRTWRFECNKANVALLQMCRSLSNKLEAGLNTRLTKTLRGESLIPWWICAVRSTTVTWKYVRSPFYIVQQSQCVPCIYIYNIYIITLSPDFCRQSSTHTRALTRTYMYVVGMVAGWRAHRWRWYDSYIRTTIICIFPFFFYWAKFHRRGLMTKGWSIGSLVLSKRFMISSLLRFIGGFAEAELCPDRKSVV